MRKKVFAILAVALFVLSLVALKIQPVSAGNCGGVETAIINCESGSDGEEIFSILGIVIKILTFGVGAAATIGVVISGYQYMTARDNSAQILKAKNRILQIVIGIVMYALFWAIINFLIPGGLA